MSRLDLLQRARVAQLGALDEDESESEEDVAAAPRAAAFAALVGSDDSDSDSAASSDPDVAEEAAEAEQEAVPVEADKEPETAPSGGRKAKKKRSSQRARAQAEATDVLEDEEARLLEAATAQACVEASAAAAADKTASTWRVDPKSLDGEGELRRRFGARAVRAAQSELRGAARGGGRGLRAGVRAMPQRRRGMLVTPKEGWPRPDCGYTQSCVGLSEEGGGASEFCFEVSGRYASLLSELEALSQHTADPAVLVELVHHEPGHVDALMRLHSIAKQVAVSIYIYARVRACMYVCMHLVFVIVNLFLFVCGLLGG